MIIHGNCLEVIKGLDEESIDAIVTDPPYELGFMGKKWDSTGIAYSVELWAECLRVLKPGGHLLAFSGTRTYHRMACAIEDAGFEIRDSLVWVYSSGMPKSLNIGKAYDKSQGNERKVVGKYRLPNGTTRDYDNYNKKCSVYVEELVDSNEKRMITKGNSQWEGFGTALKPANEPICMARKPLSEKTIVENVLKHGTGALNIDGCRIPIQDLQNEPGYRPNAKNHTTNKGEKSMFSIGGVASDDGYHNSLGRFPANVLCTDDALNDGVVTKSTGGKRGTLSMDKRGYGFKAIENGANQGGLGDSGSKSRYFDIDVWAEKHGILQFPKASKSDRGSGNTHPTVKPVHLIAWLVRLVSKDGDTVLDPFAGSGTTGVACSKLGRKYVLIEQNEEYIDIIKSRIDGATLF